MHKKVKDSRGFDPCTSGMLVQHASTAQTGISVFCQCFLKCLLNQIGTQVAQLPWVYNLAMIYTADKMTS